MERKFLNSAGGNFRAWLYHCDCDAMCVAEQWLNRWLFADFYGRKIHAHPLKRHIWLSRIELAIVLPSNSIESRCISKAAKTCIGIRNEGNVAESISNERIIAVSTVLLAQLQNSRWKINMLHKPNRTLSHWLQHVKYLIECKRKEFLEVDPQRWEQIDWDGKQGIHIAPNTL